MITLTEAQIDAFNKDDIVKKILKREQNKDSKNPAEVWAAYILTNLDDNFKDVPEALKPKVDEVTRLVATELEKKKSMDLKEILENFNISAAIRWYEQNGKPKLEEMEKRFGEQIMRTKSDIMRNADLGLDSEEEKENFVTHMKFFTVGAQGVFNLIMDMAEKNIDESETKIETFVTNQAKQKPKLFTDKIKKLYIETLNKLLAAGRETFLPKSGNQEVSMPTETKKNESAAPERKANLRLIPHLQKYPYINIPQNTRSSTSKDTGESVSLMDNRGGRIDFSANPKSVFGPPREAQDADLGSIDLGVLGDAYICGLWNSNRKKWMLLPSCLQRFAYDQLFKESVARLQLKRDKDRSNIDMSQVFLM